MDRRHLLHLAAAAAFQSHALDRVQGFVRELARIRSRTQPRPRGLGGIVRGAIADDSVATSLRRQRRGLPTMDIIRIAAS
jgi:hypothetical protein